MRLLGDEELERSAVVTNCRMNRERGLLGSNGYDRELGFDPIAFLKDRLVPGRPTTWLDLCCGTGTALIEAARREVEASTRLVVGLGPQATLKRSFAIAGDEDGRAVTSRAAAVGLASFEVEFHDGHVPVANREVDRGNGR